jgi:Homeodomain-like domain
MWHARRWRNGLRDALKRHCPKGHVGSNPTRRIEGARVRSSGELSAVKDLAADGLNDCEIARATGIPRTTVRDWRHAGFWRAERVQLAEAAHTHAFALLPPAYAYLFGLYLGDGNISHCRRGVYRLRVTLDLAYPLIIAACREAMTEVMPANPASVQIRRDGRCVEVNSYSKHWPCFFPQHGPGRKHTRLIALTDWQRDLCDRSPELLLRGLVHSDGCRSLNRVKGAGKIYAYPRYTFTNHSADIRRIFCDYLDALDIAWRPMTWRNISIARRDAVAKLDAFIGPKA